MSIAQQIRDALAATDEALTAAQLCERCSEAADTTQIASACHGMVERGELVRHKPPEGGRFLYRLTTAGIGASMRDLEAPEENATEARASRVTSSGKPHGPGPRLPAQTRSRSRAVALPVTAKAAPPRPGPSARVRVEADLQIALTDQGVLALRRGELVMYLTPEERERVDAFTARFSA